VSTLRPPTLRLLRGGFLASFAAWFLLWPELGPYYVVSVSRWPVHQPFFPWPFDEPRLATVAYVLPVGLLGLVVRPTLPGFRIGAVLLGACAAVLLLHGDAYNDATFLVGFWMGLWLFWLAGQATRTDDAVVADASALLVVLGAFLFLGGVVGKLHHEWWNGDVMQHVLVDQRTFWFYPWMRAHLSGDAQLFLARWSARAALAFEAIAVFAPLMPLRWGLRTIVVASLGVVACAGWSLFSVVGAPLATALLCLWYLPRPEALSRGTSAIPAGTAR
jgi:hypothetical protein